MENIRVFDDCIHELSRLPGIGRKTAMRLAMHILKKNKEEAYKLSSAIKNLKDNITFCKECGSIAEAELCYICQNENRQKDIICIVEEAKDVICIENTDRFYGLYHVLGGKISPLDGIGPSDLNFEKLVERVEKLQVQEVIIATNPDADGETTASYIAKILSNLRDLKITKLASGIPIGSHLEYADEMTVLRALENRVSLG